MKEILTGAIEKIVADGEKAALEEGVVKGAQELGQIFGISEAAGPEREGLTSQIFDVKEDDLSQWKEISPLVFDGKKGDLGRQGGLKACQWRCIMDYCYPVNVAKKINSSHPHRANSSVGHS